MTDKDAENIVKEIIRLRTTGFTENLQLHEPMKNKFNLSEDDTDLAIEMVSTGAFRAGLISSGQPYPPFMAHIDLDPTLKAAFKLAWIDFKGEDHYNKNWLKKETKKGFWSFLKKK